MVSFWLKIQPIVRKRTSLTGPSAVRRIEMESYLEHLTGLICIWTPEGVLSACNDAYSDFIGAARSELVGKNWVDLLPGKDRSSAMRFIDDFVSNPRRVRRERATRDASGELRWIEWIHQPISDQSGRLLQVLSEGRDVTERKRAEEAARDSEARYQRLFEEAIEGMVLADVETGTIEDCNRAFLRLTGHERTELLGRLLPLQEDGDGGRRSFPARLAASASASGDGPVIPARLVAKAGNVRDVLVKASVVQMDGRRLVHALIDDVTDRRLAERHREGTLLLLRLLNEQDQTRELLRQLADLLRDWTGCEAVAVRLREGEDFPFYEARGFRPEFVGHERSLCRYDPAGRLVLDEAGDVALDCLCGRVLRGRTDPALPCFSRRGSFWVNSLGAPDLPVTPTRAKCLAEGYESLALIPLRHGEQVLGLLQLCDHAPGRFNEALIAFLESAADQIGIALVQKAKMSSLEGGLRQIAALLTEIGVGTRAAQPALPPALRAAVASLSRRETEVLRLLLHNRRPTTIAKDLSRSVHTVRNQLKSIFRKLDVHSQEELLGRLGSDPDVVVRRPPDAGRRTRRRADQARRSHG
jgi:PAS domain S-box-containing protein